MRDERINAFPSMTAGQPSIRRRRRAEGRACRWDARPALTVRDAAALRFVGEHYAVRIDVLAVVLGRLSPATPLGPVSKVGGLCEMLPAWDEAT